MENQLQVMVTESGLEPVKGKMLLEKFGNYFELADKWDKKAKTLVVTDESQVTEMEMARTGRLFLREKRITVEKTRKELKEQSLREGKAIDGIANVLKALIVPIEQYLEKQEKFIEIKQAEKEAVVKVEVERKMEEGRIAAEKAEAKERERVRIENERLKAEAVKREQKIEEDKKKADAKLAAEKAKAEAERKKQAELLATERAKAEEKLQAEQEAKEKAIRLEREKQEKILAKQKAEAVKKAKEQEEAVRVKIAAEKKKREHLLSIIENPIECPHCHGTFLIEEGQVKT